MLQTIKDDLDTLRSGPPGERFLQYVEERRERRGTKWSAGRIISFSVGMTLIVVGLGIGWLPGPGGFLAIVGLGLIAQEFPFIAKVLDRIEMCLRGVAATVKRWFHPPESKSDER